MKPCVRPLIVIMILMLSVMQTSCGSSDDESLGVSNVSPEGSVGGLVIDAATLGAMEGASVTVIAGGRILPSADGAATTNEKGYFSVEDVPAGDLILQVVPKDPESHKSVNISAVLPNAAGEFPLANSTLTMGPIGLLPITKKEAPFKVQLITPDGAPAPANIKAFLRANVAWVDFSGTTPQPFGTVVVSSASDNSGALNFVGMPDFNAMAGLVGAGGISDQVVVSIPPYDANADGVLDFMGKEETFNVNKLKGSIPTIVLASAALPTTLKIEASTIAALAGKTGNRVLSSLSGPLFVTFNLPIEESMTEISLFDELGGSVFSAPDTMVSGNVLTINFPGLKAGAEYNLNLRVFAQAEGQLVEGNFGAPFFTPIAQGSTVQAALSQDTANPSKVIATFNEPIGTGDPGKGLAGSNAVLFFAADLDGSGVTGDAPSERGAATSSVAFSIDEVDPPGPAGLSGLATTWSFTVPTDVFGNPLPPGTAVDILFSKSTLTVQRPDGRFVSDLTNQPLP